MLDEVRGAHVDELRLPPQVRIRLPRQLLFPENTGAVDHHIGAAVGLNDVQHVRQPIVILQLTRNCAHLRTPVLALAGDVLQRIQRPRHENQGASRASQTHRNVTANAS